MTWQEALQVGTVVIWALGGGGAVVLGLSGFLGRVWVDRLKGDIDAKLQRLDAALKHRNFVLQRLADLELEGISECWRTARACRPLLNATRPIDSGTDEDVLQSRAQRLADAHDAMLEASGRHEPFLPAAMVETLDAIGTVVRSELSNIKYHKRFEGTWWEEGAKNSAALKILCDGLLAQVKTRAAELRAAEEARL